MKFISRILRKKRRERWAAEPSELPAVRRSAKHRADAPDSHRHFDPGQSGDVWMDHP